MQLSNIPICKQYHTENQIETYINNHNIQQKKHIYFSRSERNLLDHYSPQTSNLSLFVIL